MKIYIEIYSIEMNRVFKMGYFNYEEETPLLDIIRDRGLEIPNGQNPSIIEVGTKKKVFVNDCNGFKFCCTIRTG